MSQSLSQGLTSDNQHTLHTKNIKQFSQLTFDLVVILIQFVFLFLRLFLDAAQQIVGASIIVLQCLSSGLLRVQIKVDAVSEFISSKISVKDSEEIEVIETVEISNASTPFDYNPRDLSDSKAVSDEPTIVQPIKKGGILGDDSADKHTHSSFPTVFKTKLDQDVVIEATNSTLVGIFGQPARHDEPPVVGIFGQPARHDNSPTVGIFG